MHSILLEETGWVGGVIPASGADLSPCLVAPQLPLPYTLNPIRQKLRLSHASLFPGAGLSKE